MRPIRRSVIKKNEKTMINSDQPNEIHLEEWEEIHLDDEADSNQGDLKIYSHNSEEWAEEM